MDKNANVSIEHCSVINKIVLNIPHSSSRFPSKKDADAWPPAIKWQIDRWTDWYTDDIFVVDDPRVVPIIFPYSRFYCDVERLLGDPLEVVGQGIFMSDMMASPVYGQSKIAIVLCTSTIDIWPG